MKIKNCLIITDANSEIRMSEDELGDFSGNVVFSRDTLSRALNEKIEREMNGVSAEHYSSSTDRSADDA